jgi:hypothetical protein
MNSSTENRVALTNPAGVWSYENLIGAKVHVKSSSGWNGLFSEDENKSFEITEVKFKINLDGKIETVVKLSGKENVLYHLKDLEIYQVFCALNKDTDNTTDNTEVSDLDLATDKQVEDLFSDEETE